MEAPPAPHEIDPWGTGRPRTSGFAVASLVFGIIGGPLLALVFGYIALRRIKRSDGALTGRGMAIAGVTLGWVWAGILAAVVAIAVTSEPVAVPPGTPCAEVVDDVVYEVSCDSERAELYLDAEHPPGSDPEALCRPLTAYYTVDEGGRVECWRRR